MKISRTMVFALIGGLLSILAGRWTGDMRGSYIFWIGLIFGAIAAGGNPLRRKP